MSCMSTMSTMCGISTMSCKSAMSTTRNWACYGSSYNSLSSLYYLVELGFFFKRNFYVLSFLNFLIIILWTFNDSSCRSR